MRISVFGLGYVGSVSAVCLADVGHEVIGIDIVTDKVEGLNAGHAPVKEPQLDELLQKNLKTGRLHFTENIEEAISSSDCAMITVGTPSKADGSANLNAVERCIESIAAILANSKKEKFYIVIRSTVPPGTTARMKDLAENKIKEYSSGGDICQLTFTMNPEFTREGAAVEDFFKPAIIVFGLDEEEGKSELAKIYQGIEAETIWTPTQTAELVKYTNNAFHALKVTFANEIGRIADAHDIDGKDIMKILCTDHKLNISSKYLRPGFAFGGSCLPKDLRGINAIATEKQISVPLLDSLLESNQVHIRHFQSLIENNATGRIGILGIAFKAKTDDLRESPALQLICHLIDQGLEVKMLDVNLETAYLMGRNKQYIDVLLPNWSKHYASNEKDFFENSDTIVVTNHEPIYVDWIKQYGQDKAIFTIY